MARKSKLSYSAVELDAPSPAPAEPAIPQPVAEAGPKKAAAGPRGRPPVSTLMRDASKPVVLYLHPAGHKALKRFALEADRKVHDLLIEAVEEWARKKALREPMRVSAP
jgi:hypothetical protein